MLITFNVTHVYNLSAIKNLYRVSIKKVPLLIEFLKTSLPAG